MGNRGREERSQDPPDYPVRPRSFDLEIPSFTTDGPGPTPTFRRLTHKFLCCEVTRLARVGAAVVCPRAPSVWGQDEGDRLTPTSEDPGSSQDPSFGPVVSVPRPLSSPVSPPLGREDPSVSDLVLRPLVLQSSSYPRSERNPRSSLLGPEGRIRRTGGTRSQMGGHFPRPIGSTGGFQEVGTGRIQTPQDSGRPITLTEGPGRPGGEAQLSRP